MVMMMMCLELGHCPVGDALCHVPVSPLSSPGLSWPGCSDGIGYFSSAGCNSNTRFILMHYISLYLL